MRNKLKTCFMLIVVVSMIGLFYCSRAIAAPCAESLKRQAENAKKPPIILYRNPDGTLTTTPPVRVRYRPRVRRVTAMEKPDTVKKEIPAPVPLSVQAANLREAFEKFPVSDSDEVCNALKKSFEAQVAKLIHEKCQSRKDELLKMVGEESINKDAVAASVQIIATDEYKKAALEFIKSLNPEIKIELSEPRKSNSPMDPNSSVGFVPLSWQSKRYPVNPKYTGHIFDKFSADVNDTVRKEAVRIFKALVAEAESLDSATVNLAVMPIEDVNLVTEPEQFESTEAPASSQIKQIN